MKRFIKIAGIAGMLLAAAVYGLKSAGYLQESSASGTTAYVSDAALAATEAADVSSGGTAPDDTAEDQGASAEGAMDGVQQDPAGDGIRDADPSDAAGTQETASESRNPAIMVYVCGCVNSPGVYGFDEGARFYEAIEAAGGFTEEAEETYMNLAAYLSDGIKIYVPSQGEIPEGQAVSADGYPQADGTVSSSGAVSYEASDTRIDINTADEDALQTLPGIGPSRAADIVSYRKKNGPFSSIEDIMKVPGIKDAAFSKIKDMIVAR